MPPLPTVRPTQTLPIQSHTSSQGSQLRELGRAHLGSYASASQFPHLDRLGTFRMSSLHSTAIRAMGVGGHQTPPPAGSSSGGASSPPSSGDGKSGKFDPLATMAVLQQLRIGETERGNLRANLASLDDVNELFDKQMADARLCLGKRPRESIRLAVEAARTALLMRGVDRAKRAIDFAREVLQKIYTDGIAEPEDFTVSLNLDGMEATIEAASIVYAADELNDYSQAVIMYDHALGMIGSAYQSDDIIELKTYTEAALKRAVRKAQSQKTPNIGQNLSEADVMATSEMRVAAEQTDAMLSYIMESNEDSVKNSPEAADLLWRSGIFREREGKLNQAYQLFKQAAHVFISTRDPRAVLATRRASAMLAELTKDQGQTTLINREYEEIAGLHIVAEVISQIDGVKAREASRPEIAILEYRSLILQLRSPNISTREQLLEEARIKQEMAHIHFQLWRKRASNRDELNHAIGCTKDARAIYQTLGLYGEAAERDIATAGLLYKAAQYKLALKHYQQALETLQTAKDPRRYHELSLEIQGMIGLLSKFEGDTLIADSSYTVRGSLDTNHLMQRLTGLQIQEASKKKTAQVLATAVQPALKIEAVRVPKWPENLKPRAVWKDDAKAFFEAERAKDDFKTKMDATSGLMAIAKLELLLKPTDPEKPAHPLEATISVRDQIVTIGRFILQSKGQIPALPIAIAKHLVLIAEGKIQLEAKAGRKADGLEILPILEEATSILEHKEYQVRLDQESMKLFYRALSQIAMIYNKLSEINPILIPSAIDAHTKLKDFCAENKLVLIQAEQLIAIARLEQRNNKRRNAIETAKEALAILQPLAGKMDPERLKKGIADAEAIAKG